MEGVEDVGVAPCEVLRGCLQPRVLVYLLVNLPAVGLDVVVEPCHHGVPGTHLRCLMLGKIKHVSQREKPHLGSCKVSGSGAVLEFEELHPLLVLLEAEIIIIASFTDFLSIYKEDLFKIIIINSCPHTLYVI